MWISVYSQLCARSLLPGCTAAHWSCPAVCTDAVLINPGSATYTARNTCCIVFVGVWLLANIPPRPHSTDVCQLNVGTVETAATVFKTLEALFTKYDTSTLPLQSTPLKNTREICFEMSTSNYQHFVYSPGCFFSLPLAACVRLCGELEGSILEISDVYPLFTFLVWRVLAHLSPASR